MQQLYHMLQQIKLRIKNLMQLINHLVQWKNHQINNLIQQMNLLLDKILPTLPTGKVQDLIFPTDHSSAAIDDPMLEEI
ncbi:hypothetical protein P3S68_020320 [Capsicum galapagoense]